MAANKSSSFIFLLFSVLLAPCASANDEVLALLSRDVATKFAQLGQIIEQCQETKKTSAPPVIEVEKLKALNISKNQALTALAYLSHRNGHNCEYQTRTELLFAVTLLDNARKEYDKPATNVQSPLTELTLPDTGYFELAIDFAKLPQSARSHMEQVAGNKPFSFVETVHSLPDY